MPENKTPGQVAYDTYEFYLGAYGPEAIDRYEKQGMISRVLIEQLKEVAYLPFESLPPEEQDAWEKVAQAVKEHMNTER